ncbi:Chromo-like domain superfamily [Sesbania bispinosa]|nr:Chromo-like domain superfamily [Sesbania bispinosa]
MAKYWYNTNFHSSIKMAPFQALYGRPPPPFGRLYPGSSSHASVDELLVQRSQLLSQLKANLCQARHIMKQLADMNRKECIFAEGDWVYLKLAPYRQTFVHRRQSQKLALRFYRIFQILHRIGPCVSQLPTSSFGTHPLLHPTEILGSHFVTIQGTPHQQLLVKWDSLSEQEATWESLTSLRASFPNLDLEDKVLLNGRGNDTGPVT